MSKTKKTVYFAVAHRAVEDFIEKEMANEIEVIGSAVYRESVLQAIEKEEPDILIMRETLPGKTDFLEIIDTVRVKCQKHVQIIVMVGEREPGDEFLSALVRYSVFDLVIGDNINIRQVCNLIRKPNVWKDVCMYVPKVKIDEKTKKQIFELPVVPKVIEKEVIREIIVDHTDIVDTDVLDRTNKEMEKIKQEKIEIENEQKKIKQEKEQLSREKESLIAEKKRIEQEYEQREAEFEKSMELRLNAIYEEKERLIEIERKRIQGELDFAISEKERIKSEAEIMIDEEKKRIHESKQAEIEKNIEILTLEYEHKIKKLEQEAEKKIQLEQQKHTQMKINEIEKFKQENAQLEEKYRVLKEDEAAKRKSLEKESQKMKDEISLLKERQAVLEAQREDDLKALEEARRELESEKQVKYNAQSKAEEELKQLELELRVKEEELKHEKELIEMRYVNLENNLIDEYEKMKLKVQQEATKELEASKIALKNKIQQQLELEKSKLIASGVNSKEELTKMMASKQSQANSIYTENLKKIVENIKKQTAEKMLKLEQEAKLQKQAEKEKIAMERASLNDEKEKLTREMQKLDEDRKVLELSIKKERELLEQKQKEIEENAGANLLEQERFLENERASLRKREEELNEKIRLFNEEQQKMSIEKEEAYKAQKTEKEKELEAEKQKLLQQQESFEIQKFELEEKYRRENEEIRYKLKQLEKEKEILSKMKAEAANMQGVNISGKNIITFLGSKAGVGTTTVAFNTAISLASKGNKVLYLELNKEFSSVSYTYKLGFYDSGIDLAMKQVSENKYEDVLNNITLLEDVEKNTPKDDIMQRAYKKMPKTLDYLFYSGKYYSGEEYYSGDSFKDLIMYLLVKLDYDYIVFDMNMGYKNSENNLVLDDILKDVIKFSSKIYFIITQDLASIGACLNARNVMKRTGIPVNDFKFIANRYEPKANLSKQVLSEWLKVDIDLALVDKHKEVVDANYEGIPLVLYSNDREISKFYKSMVADIVEKNKKK